ncbi:MAG: histidine phosphatase family protein [Firmicutes bacterium]|nr:histidine phosphatase family protein [Bacillota bacterium]
MGFIRKLYLIRHCQATGQEPDSLLTKQGMVQADMLAKFLLDKGITRIVSSPFARAVESIRPLATKLSLDIELNDDLAERKLAGVVLEDWYSELRRSFDDFDVRLPGGESNSEAMMRGKAALDHILGYPDSNIAVVTHGNLLVLLLRLFDEVYGFENWAALSNPDVFEVTIEDKGTSVERIWPMSEDCP